MTEITDDILFEDAVHVSADAESRLTAALRQLAATYAEIAGLEAAIKQQEEKLQRLLKQELPEAMGDARQAKMTLENGMTLERKHILSGNWPQDHDNIQRAIDWLSKPEVDGESLLKATVKVEFDKGDRDAAQQFFRVAETNNAKRKATYSESVHYQTLNAFFRDCHKRGIPIPLEVFNGYSGWTVEISQNGTKRKKKV